MKKITLSLFSIAVLAFTGQMTAQTVDSSSESNQNPNPVDHEFINPATSYQVSGAVIYSNGPYFNVPGGGFGGADLSEVETVAFGMNTWGIGHQTSAGNRIADDWEVTESVEVSSIDFYAYQTNSTTTSTMTGVTLLVWDGDPGDPASSVIYGDDAISAMINTEWSGAYRAFDTEPTNSARPIMRNTVETPGLTLTPGTYWLDWDADGSLASGPWAPFVVITGQANTGNGKQSIAGVWGDYFEGGSGAPQGFPFEVTGTVLSLVDNTFEGFSFYPNPTTNILNVNAKASIENITIYNVLGQELITVAPGNINAKVDMSGLSTGMYVMKATVNGTVGSFNIVKR